MAAKEVPASPVEAAPVEADPIAERDPLDATTEVYTDADADESGWIVYYEPPERDGTRRWHRVPVCLWPAYEKSHGF